MRQDKDRVMHPDTKKYNAAQAPDERKLCDLLAREIDRGLPEADNKIWHAHPGWFLDGTPVQQAKGLRALAVLEWSVL